jgi:hypothetical protein
MLNSVGYRDANRGEPSARGQRGWVLGSNGTEHSLKDSGDFLDLVRWAPQRP